MATKQKRDPYALPAKMRKAGRHKDRKKAKNKRACRGRNNLTE